MKQWPVILILLAAMPFGVWAEKNPFNGFIENKGQWDASVQYRKKVPNGFLFLQPTGWTYYLSNTWNASSHAEPAGDPAAAFEESAPTGLSQVLSTTFLHANPAPAISHLNAQSYYHNFFVGNEAQWASEVREYDEVQYCELYDKIDLKVFSMNGAMKYDLVVSPGGNPEDIVMEWKGAEELYVSDGRLMVETEFGSMVEQRPYAYQLTGHDTLEVAARFVVRDKQVSFDFPDGYDEQHTLVIDPLLIFSTYSGSSADNWGNTATYDARGNTYAGGIIFGASVGAFVPPVGVFQADFKGEFDVVLMKFDSTGSQLLYATYLGGAFGETPVSLIVNSQDELVVYGVTSSPGFPVTANAFQPVYGGGSQVTPLGEASINYANGSDIFLCKFNATGTQLLASTFLGGSDNDGIIPEKGTLTLNYGDQFRGEVNIDQNDNIYIASSSHSANFPMDNQLHGFGGQVDGVLVKMDKGLASMHWGTFVGGDSTDVLQSVKPDGNGGVYAVGGTASQSFPFGVNGWQRSLAGNSDGFVLHINEASLTIDAASYLGSTATDQAYMMDLDLAGNVYVMGQTKGNYPVLGNAYRNAGSGQFLHKLNASLTTTAWSTVFGSGTVPSNISPTAFLVSDCNNIYISGWGGGNNITGSYNQSTTYGLPLTADAAQTNTDGQDFYLMVLEPDAQGLLYATYFGGLPSMDHVDGGTSRFDKRGVVHHAVCAGCGINASNYPTSTGAWSESNNSPNCNLGVFKFDLSTLAASFTTNTPDLLNPEVTEGCAPFTFLFTNESVGGETYFWSLGDGTISTNPDTVIHTYNAPGEYTISLRATNPNTCKNQDIVTRKILLKQGSYTLSPSTTICYGESVPLEATGGTSYYWIPNNAGLSTTSSASTVASPTRTTTYFVTIFNETNRCTFIDSVTVNVLEEITISSEIEAVYDCSGVSEYLFTGAVQGTDLAYWDFGDGTQATELSGSHVYGDGGTYTARLVAPNELCMEEVAEELKVGELMVPNAFSPNGDGINEQFEIQFTDPLPITLVDRSGKMVFQHSAYTNQWDGGGLPAGIYYYNVTLPDFTTCNGWVHLMR